MYAHEYGLKYLKHKTNFNDMVVFSDVLQNKIKDTNLASTNLYLEIEKGVQSTNKWFVHFSSRLSGEYGDFFLDNNPPVGEVNSLEYEVTDENKAFVQNYITDFYSDTIPYYKINEKFYIKIDGAITLDEIIITGPASSKPKEEINIEFDAFITLLISEDGAQLEHAYQTITNVNAHQVVIFIERGTGTNAFGTVFRIRKGKNVKTLPEVNRLKITEITRAFGVQVVANELSTMIREELKNQNNLFYILLNKTLSNTGRILRWVPDKALTGISGGLKYVSKEIDALKLADDRWKTTINGKTNEKFNPLLPKLTNEGTIAIEQFTNTLYKTYISPLATKTLDSVKELEKHKLIRKLIPFDFSLITKTLEGIPSVIKSFLEIVQSQLTQLYDFINGLLVGLINSIIEFIKSIFDILALLFDILNGTIQSTKFFENPSSYLSLFVESFENLIDAITNTFTLTNIKKFFGFIASLPVKAYKAVVSLVNNISEIDINIDPGAVGYYLGFIVGFIASEVVIFFATGGVGNISKAIKAVFQSYKALATTTAKAVKSVVSFGLDTFVKLIKNIVAFSKNIPKYLDELSKLIDDFVAGLQAKSILINNVAFSVIDPITAFASTVFKIFKASSWKKISNLGVSMLKSEDGIYTFLYNGQNIAQDLSKSQAEEFLKEIFSKIKNQSDDFVKKYLDEVLNTQKITNTFKQYLSLRKKYLRLNKRELYALWDDLNVIKRETLSDKELYNLYFKHYNKYLRKSKKGNKLKSKLEGRNFAEFEIKRFDGKGKLLERSFELSHSGLDKIDNAFLDVVTDKQFLKNVEDFEGIRRGYDSEVRFIYNFIKQHLTKEGNFEIVTKNIFIACDSCKRELLMLQELMKGRGSIKIISIDEIKGTKILKEYLNIK